MLVGGQDRWGEGLVGGETSLREKVAPLGSIL